MHFSQLVPTRMLLMKTVSRRVSWRPRRLKDGEFENAAGVEAARHRIAKMRLDLIRQRALNVCIRLESLELDALQMCEISTPACGRLASLIPFHIWWKIGTWKIARLPPDCHHCKLSSSMNQNRTFSQNQF
jgi:hypothetical protein